MGSRRTTRDEDARLLEISRRTLIAGAPVAAFATSRSVLAEAVPPAAADEGVHKVEQWLALDHKIERLQERWARLEDWLAREHAWFELSPAEQRTLPWARELDDIDGAIETLVERRDDLLTALSAVRGTSLDSIQLRLAVAERLIWPDVHPEAHSLIAGARQDLIAFSNAAA